MLSVSSGHNQRPNPLMTDSLPVSQKVSIICGLLQNILSFGVYNIGSDHVEGGGKLQVLQKVAEWILEAGDGGVKEWYDCFTVLLELHPTCLEKLMVSVLSKAWLRQTQVRAFTGTTNVALTSGILCGEASR